MLGSLTQGVEALEVAYLLHRRPVQPRCQKEEEVSDDVSITKSLASNYQSSGRTRTVKVHNLISDFGNRVKDKLF